MQLRRRVIALAQLSDPTLHPKDGCPHLLTLLGHGEETQINGLEGMRDKKTTDINFAKILLDLALKYIL